MGNTMAHTRELAWWTGRFGTRLEVTVVPESERTTIRVVRDARRSAGLTAFFTLGLTMFPIGPLIGMIMIEGMGVPDEIGVITAMAASLALVWKAGRGLIRWGNRRIAAHAQSIADRLTAKVRSSIKD
jgi:hypothetical protein